MIGTNKLAERVGFEPTVPCGTPDFESGTFGHSATSPRGLLQLGEAMILAAYKLEPIVKPEAFLTPPCSFEVPQAP